MKGKSTKNPTLAELTEARRSGYRVVGWFQAYCSLQDCCEICDPRVRFGCKIVNGIRRLQTSRILKICREEAARRERFGRMVANAIAKGFSKSNKK